MNYYLDSEFIEGFTCGLLTKRRHFIDMISIALVAEDGRQYYSISRDFDPYKANEWVAQHVFRELIWHCIYDDGLFPDEKKRDRMLKTGKWDVCRQIQFAQHLFGKSKKAIAKDIFDFVNPGLGWHVSSYSNSELKDGKPMSEHFDKHNVSAFDDKQAGQLFYAQPTFYGYYADYDWVLFASLFGTMMDIPPGFPMYCRDLKQTMDEKANSIPGDALQGMMLAPNDTLKEVKLRWLKEHKDYPTNEREHCAITDAKFNFNLHKFLSSVIMPSEKTDGF